MERYVERCYRSLAIQKDADDIEFIFVNDGSSDKTLSILKEIKACDSRVVIVDQKNAGVSSARNSALTIAKGEYVYLLDGDDYLTIDAIFEIKQVVHFSGKHINSFYQIPVAVIFNFEHTSKSPEGFIKTQITGPRLRVSNLVGLG